MTGSKISDVSTTENSQGSRVECQTPGCSGASEWDGRSMSALSSKSGWNPAGSGGKLFLKMLLPLDGTFRKRGGNGFEHWRQDRNFPFAGVVSISSHPTYEGRGKWRIEEETSGRLDDLFLNVLYPTDATVTAMPETVLVDATSVKGAHIKDSSLNLVALFSADPQGASPAGTIVYTILPTASSRHFLFNVPAMATFSVSVSTTTGQQTLTISPAPSGSHRASGAGVSVFDVQAGGIVEQPPPGGRTPPAAPTGLKLN